MDVAELSMSHPSIFICVISCISISPRNPLFLHQCLVRFRYQQIFVNRDRFFRVSSPSFLFFCPFSAQDEC